METAVAAVNVHHFLRRRFRQSRAQPNDALLKMNDVRLQPGKQIAPARPSGKVFRTFGADEMTRKIRALSYRPGPAVCKHKFCGRAFGVEIIRDRFTDTQLRITDAAEEMYGDGFQVASEEDW